jgi:hypothetical protein
VLYFFSLPRHTPVHTYTRLSRTPERAALSWAELQQRTKIADRVSKWTAPIWIRADPGVRPFCTKKGPLPSEEEETRGSACSQGGKNPSIPVLSKKFVRFLKQNLIFKIYRKNQKMRWFFWFIDGFSTDFYLKFKL